MPINVWNQFLSWNTTYFLTNFFVIFPHLNWPVPVDRGGGGINPGGLTGGKTPGGIGRGGGGGGGMNRVRLPGRKSPGGFGRGEFSRREFSAPLFVQRWFKSFISLRLGFSCRMLSDSLRIQWRLTFAIVIHCYFIYFQNYRCAHVFFNGSSLIQLFN